MDPERRNYIADFAGRATLIAVFRFLTTNKIVGVINKIKGSEEIQFLISRPTSLALLFVMLSWA